MTYLKSVVSEPESFSPNLTLLNLAEMFFSFQQMTKRATEHLIDHNQVSQILSIRSGTVSAKFDRETTIWLDMSVEATMKPELKHLVFAYGTLKRGEPNFKWLTKEAVGSFQVLAVGKTVQKRALVIGSRYNVPYLLDHSGSVGNFRSVFYATRVKSSFEHNIWIAVSSGIKVWTYLLVYVAKNSSLINDGF